jgi:SNF2 family DNA or RNA helicase
VKYNPYPYQDYNSTHIIKNSKKEGAGCLLDMGLGKTASTLKAIDLLLNYYMVMDKVLIVAPPRVAENVWIDEVNKWDDFKHLKVSLVIGDVRKRKAALMAKADIYCMSVHNVPWLLKLFNNNFPFDMLVIDESSMFKNHQALKFKALKVVRPLIKRVVILTGTPAPNGLHDLWSQIYLLDRGKRLGKNITQYRERFFVRKHNGFGYTVRPDASEDIYRRISDICVSMKSEDYLQLPKLVRRKCMVHMPPSIKDEYDDFEEEQVLNLSNGEEITALNAGALYNKLSQFANGAIYYDEEKNFHELHKAKLEALEDIVDTSQGNNLLVFYWFKHDLQRLKKRFPKARTLKTRQDILDWNNGKIAIALAHPASTGHGLNLQTGGSICIWYSLTWDLQLYQQANKRLHRPGQTKTVIILHLVCAGTIDELILKALKEKTTGQDALMHAVRWLQEKYDVAS